jgi:hypothetical protein
MKTFSQTRLEQAITLIVDENKLIREVSIRCPYCGDSKRDPRATHMGVKFAYPPQYHCFKCDESGVIGVRFLKDVGVDEAIIKKYSKYKKTSVYKSLPVIKEVAFNKKKYDYEFKFYKDCDQYKYLCSRFKMEFTQEDISRFKVILNPTVFLKDWIAAKKSAIEPKMDLSRYIGFLTQDGNQAVFRAIDKDKEPRFFNLTIEETAYRKLYIVDNVIDMKAEKYNFVLTEGIFDIIGVYKHFYEKNGDLSNTIFLAGLGKGFQEPINRLIQNGFLNFDIYLYADTSDDIVDDFFIKLFTNPYIEEVYVARNTKEGEKDFGVSLDRIEFNDFELFNKKKIKELIANKEKTDNKKKA